MQADGCNASAMDARTPHGMLRTMRQMVFPYNDRGDSQMCGGHGPNIPSGSSLQRETDLLQFFPITDVSFPITNADVVTVCGEVSTFQCRHIRKYDEESCPQQSVLIHVIV